MYLISFSLWWDNGPENFLENPMFTDVHELSNADHFTACLKGKQMLQDPAYRQTWLSFREHIPLSDFDFEQYYTSTLASFAEYVQSIPATRHVFYAHPGGMFQLGLDRAIVSTKLAIKAYQDFEAKTPDEFTAYEQAELFAVFSAALLSDLGLLNLRFNIKVSDGADYTRNYDPYRGSLLEQGKSYTYEFANPELGDWSAPASLVLGQRLLSRTHADYRDSGFAWISRYHEILQLWYAMLLELTPVTEGTTRKRYLVSLIPLTDSDLVQNFLLNIHNQGLLLPSRQSRTLFSPNTPEETLQERGFQLDNTTEAVLRARSEFEKVFGEGLSPADASNTRVLGSLGAGLSPQLRYGLGFLGWLMALARSGRLFASDAQARWAFGGGDGKLVLDINRAIQEFAKAKDLPKVSAQELINGLKDVQIFKSQNMVVRQFELNSSNPAVAKRQFEALVLDANFIFGQQVALQMELGLKALAATASSREAPTSLAQAARRALFHRTPGL